MKKIFILLLFFLNYNLHAQKVVQIKHASYTSLFCIEKYYPLMVEWWETTAKAQCATPTTRKDKFKPDPLLPKETNLKKDYIHSGTDRGHMCPAAINKCKGEKEMEECFYFSNMAPQYHSLNAGDWEALERFTRKTAIQQDSIHIWAGNIGESKKIGKVSVPIQCWKVIHILNTKEYKAYLFNNDLSKADGIKNNEVTVHHIEQLTGFKFL
jgi:endonuclease G